MTKLLAGIDRFLVLVLGLAAVIIGAWALILYFQVPYVYPYAEWVANHLDGRKIVRFAQTDAYITALWGVAIPSTVIGLLLIAYNLQPRTFNRQGIAAQPDVDISVARLARAIGDFLKEEPQVTDVRPSVAWDRDRQVVQWTIYADATVDIPLLQAQLAGIEADFRDAVEDLDVDTRYLIHLGLPTK